MVRLASPVRFVMVAVVGAVRTRPNFVEEFVGDVRTFFRPAGSIDDSLDFVWVTLGHDNLNTCQGMRNNGIIVCGSSDIHIIILTSFARGPTSTSILLTSAEEDIIMFFWSLLSLVFIFSRLLLRNIIVVKIDLIKKTARTAERVLYIF